MTDSDGVLDIDLDGDAGPGLLVELALLGDLLGSFDDLRRIVEEKIIDEVVFILPPSLEVMSTLPLGSGCSAPADTENRNSSAYCQTASPAMGLGCGAAMLTREPRPLVVIIED